MIFFNLWIGINSGGGNLKEERTHYLMNIYPDLT